VAVLVTGGAGFLGSHLVDACVARGEHAIIVDNLSTGRLSNVERPLESGDATFVYHDVASPAHKLAAAIAKAANEPITYVYHLTSSADPEGLALRPWDALAINGIGTMALIDFAAERGLPMLYASTSDIYGDPVVHPQPESYGGNVDPIGPRAGSEEGKRFGEAAMAIAMRERGLDGRIVRLFNCYGPRMELGGAALIPALLGAARNGTPLSIHGSGRQTRSLTYVEDIVEGILTVARWRCDGCRPVNLGSEEERSVEQIVSTFVEATGVEVSVARGAARPGDPQRRRPVTDVARSLGWEPKTSLVEGLRRTYAWFVGEALEYA
jgi:nucleoside-diphosphate-sugar epimerase